MLGIGAEPKYAEVMERVIYNSGLSPLSVDGVHFCYTNPLRWYGGEHQRLSHDTPARWFTHNCYCCPPQVARTIARMQDWAYSLSDEGVWVHLYGGNRAQIELGDGSPLTLTQETDYPWAGDVKIAIEKAPDHPLALLLRIPAWADGATIAVNGEAAGVEATPGAYAVLRRRWSPGDELRLALPMVARLVQAHPRVEEARNLVAVTRGPVVYCLESVDLPDGVNVAEIYLPRDAAWRPRHDPKFLGGVTVLEGQACRVHQGDWEDQLYRDLKALPVDRVPLALIPYYAWNNRGVSEMTVWMPLC
jgi:DUF1680 family protein